jgi:hypothetical protein
MGRVCSVHGVNRNAYRILVGKLKEKGLGRSIRTLKDNIKRDL